MKHIKKQADPPEKPKMKRETTWVSGEDFLIAPLLSITIFLAK